MKLTRRTVQAGANIIVTGVYLSLSLLSPSIVHAATNCTDPSKCVDSQDLYSLTSNTPWSDPRDGPPTNSCSSGSSDPSAADPTLPKTPTVTFPANSSIETKIAQTLMVGVDVGSMTPSDVTAIVKKYPIGGIYFTNTTDAAAKGYTATFFKQLDTLAGTKLAIASDEEGASSTDNQIIPIHRFNYGSTDFPVAKDLGSKNASQIEATVKAAGQVMKDAGITADLAPVLDLDNGRGADPNSVISKYGRSFSADPAKVTTAAGAFATGLQDSGITPVFKHFPGIGSAWDQTNGNNTDAAKIVGPSLSDLKKSDLLPYQKLVGQANAAVMLSNEYIPEWDGGKLPVSESPDAVKSLRTDYKFTGLIMTDSLSGPANYQNGGSVAVAATRAEQAGANMVLFEYKSGNNTVDLQSVINSIHKSSLLATNTARLDDSIAKIIAFKNQTGNGTGVNNTGGISCCSSAPGTSLSSGKDSSLNKLPIFQYFTGKGLSPAQAAGIMGNMQTESGFEPERAQYGTYNGHTFVPGVKVPVETIISDGLIDWTAFGWGIIQWTTPKKMVIPTQAAHRDPNNLGTQLDFIWGEMFGKTGELGSTENYRYVGAELKADTTPEQASNTYGKREGYGTDTAGLRAGFARSIYVSLTNGTPAPPNATPVSDSSCASTFGSPGPSDISAYANPLRDIPKGAFNSNRVDQGVDYVGTGPIHPLGNAKLLRITSPWCASSCTKMNPDNFIEYQLTDGPAKDKYVYVAEACDVKVHVSSDPNRPTLLTKDTVLCVMNPDSIEMGWANGPNDSYALAHTEYKSASTCSGNGYVTSYGQNFDKLMQKLGAPAGTHDPNCGISKTALPAGWPQW